MQWASYDTLHAVRQYAWCHEEGAGGSQVCATMTLFWKELNIWLKFKPKTFWIFCQMHLPLSHLNWIFCRCPLRMALHHLSMCFCLHFTFNGSYYFKMTYVMRWGHSLARWSYTQTPLVLLAKCSLSCNPPEGFQSRQKWPDVERRVQTKRT